VDLHRVTAGDAVVVLDEDAVKPSTSAKKATTRGTFETASAGIAWTKDVCSVVTFEPWSLLGEV
jgi:hypothetical protein